MSGETLLDRLVEVIEGVESTYEASYQNAVLIMGLNGDGGHRLARFLGEDLETHDDAPTDQPQRFTTPGQDFYALPEFQHFENIDKHLANGHFLKHVVRDAKLVKFVITAKYATLSNNKAALELLNNVASFIPDVNKFQHSLMLVIQDAEHHSVKKVVNFLNVLKHNDGVSNNLKALIDILVNPNHITTIPKVTQPQTRTEIKEFLDQNAEFQYAEETDFQFMFNYAISDENKDLIKEGMRDMIKHLEEDLEEVVEHAIKNIDHEMDKRYNNIPQLKQWLGNRTESLRTFEKPTTVSQLSKDLTLLSANVDADYPIIPRILKSVYNLAIMESYIHEQGDLQSVIPQGLDNLYPIMVKVKEHVDDWNAWMDYFEKVNAMFMNDGAHWQLESLEKRDFNKFYRDLRARADFMAVDLKFKRLPLDGVRYRMMHDMLKFRSDMKWGRVCDGDVWRIETDSYIFEDLRYLNHYECPDARKLDIFALDSMSFRTNFTVEIEMPNTLDDQRTFDEIAVIAPKWDAGVDYNTTARLPIDLSFFGLTEEFDGEGSLRINRDDADKNSYFLMYPIGKSEGRHDIISHNPGQIVTSGRLPEIGAILERYRNMLRYHISDPFQVVQVADFLRDLHQSPSLIKDYYGFKEHYNRDYGTERYHAEFMQVYNNLEEHFRSNKNREHLAYFYQLFLQDIFRIMEVFANNREELMFYHILYATVYMKMMALKNRDNAMISDFMGYMNNVLENIKKQRSSMQIVNVNNAQAVYEESLKARIQEAMRFTTQVNTGIDTTVVSIEKQINKFIGEMDKVTEKLRDHRDQLVTEDEKMKRNILSNRIFGFLKVISSVVHLLGPIGAVVGDVANIAVGIEDEIDIALPENLKNIGKQIDTITNAVFHEKFNAFNDEVAALHRELKQIKNEDAKEIEEVLHRHTKGWKNPNQEAHDRNALQRAVMKELREKEQQLEMRKKKNDTVLRKLKRFNDAVSVAEESMNVYKEWKNNDEKLSEIGKKIKEMERNSKDFEVYREKVEETVESLLTQLRADFNGRTQALDVNRWDIKTRLTDLKIYMRQFLLSIDNTSGVKEDIAAYVDKLEDTMNTFINIYDRIDALKERKVMEKYIAHVNNAQSQFATMKNQTKRDELERMNVHVQENLVLLQYETFRDQIKQRIFPFATRFLQDTIVGGGEQITKENKAMVFENYAQNIERLRNKMEMYKTLIVNEQDSQLFFSLFSTKYISTRPFFTWRKENHAARIDSLLQGKEVFLSADVNSAHKNKWGMKFNMIGLEFTTDDPEDQKTLDGILKNVMISMTHTGNSYYRCDNDVYMITNEPQTLHYSYETRERSLDPMTINEVYKKLKSGDVILSPYTMWKVQLGIKQNRQQVMQELAKFKGKVNVSLKGKGFYTKEATVCNNMGYYAKNKVEKQEVFNQASLYLEPLVLSNQTNIDEVVDQYRHLNQFVEPPLERPTAHVTSSVVNSVTQNVFNWFYDKWNSTSATTSFHPSYDTNSSLLLLDVMYKKFTNKKFEPIGMRRDVPWLVLQAEAIKLTAALEKIIDTLVMYSEGAEHFDPVVVQKELMHLLRTSNADTINTYLLDTVKQSVPLASISQIEDLMERGQLFA